MTGETGFGGRVWRDIVLSTQFFCKSKTALKKQSLLNFLKNVHFIDEKLDAWDSEKLSSLMQDAPGAIAVEEAYPGELGLSLKTGTSFSNLGANSEAV